MVASRKYVGLKDPIKIGLHLDKISKVFQVTVTIWKRKNIIWKILDEQRIWSKDQNVILQVFSDEFHRRFKKDLNVNIC